MSPSLRHAGTAAILYICAAHLVQAVLILLYWTAGGSTPLLALAGAIHAVDGVSPDETAIVLLVTLTLAAWGTLFPLGRYRVLLFLPQQFLLGIMGFGGLVAAWHGAYLDGTVIPWPHIATDQIAWLALFFIHMNAIVRRSRDRE